MKMTKWAAFPGIAVLLASALAALAAGVTPRQTARVAPHAAPAKALAAPAPLRPAAPPGTVPGMIGERPDAPAERMADTITEYYASGKIRLR